jgi:hypothetical protein
MRHKNSFDLKSQHFHNRMVNDLRKIKAIPNYCLKGRTINKDELHTTFISHTERMNLFCLSGS